MAHQASFANPEKTCMVLIYIPFPISSWLTLLPVSQGLFPTQFFKVPWIFLGPILGRFPFFFHQASFQLWGWFYLLGPLWRNRYLSGGGPFQFLFPLTPSFPKFFPVFLMARGNLLGGFKGRNAAPFFMGPFTRLLNSCG